MRSNLIGQNHDADFEIVIDAWINESAKISRTEFSQRIRNVKGIRTRHFLLGFYLNDARKLKRFETLHEIVNTGKFKNQIFTTDKLFALGLPKKLFLWLKNITVTTLYRQILNWHAAYYAFNSFQAFAEVEFDPLVLKEVKKILKEYYPENYKEKFNLSRLRSREKYDAKKKLGLEYYYNVSKNYTGSLPPEFLKNPYSDPLSTIRDDSNNWGLLADCNFELLISYFNELDWIIIVERSAEKLKKFHQFSYDTGIITMAQIRAMIDEADNDYLERAESDPEMWQKWKHTFDHFEIRKEFTYSLLPNSEPKMGYVYLQQDESLATKIGWTKKKL